MVTEGGGLEEPKHLLDVVRRLRPKAALFTTYTFSISYFDAVFVPVLRSFGCQDIAVLVDADESAKCAEEGQSRAVGRVYLLAPIRAPGGGVFHPKLAYFASDAEDVLCIGSGNLTASGQSLQLESFDAVSSVSAPTVFNELAGWMNQLAQGIASTCPQAADALTQTARRAGTVANRQRATQRVEPLPPRLVHSLSGSARQMLEAIFQSASESLEMLTVLAPFHAPDGGPVVRLARNLSASRVSVGLDGRTLVAPVDPNRFSPPMPFRYVVPEAAEANRRLHAKVIELVGAKQTLVVTGSINATSQSLESDKNVELSLARWLRKSPFRWRKVQPLGHAATQDPSDFAMRQHLYVDAWLDIDSVLHGRLTTRATIPSLVDVELRCGDVIAFRGEVAVDECGRFTAGPLPTLEWSSSALLRVTAHPLTASCWLTIQEVLAISAEERERRSAVNRVLKGDYESQDVVHVIQLLSAAVASIATRATPRPANASRGEAHEDGSAPFSFARWEASGRQRVNAGLLGRNPYDVLRALNRWLNEGAEAHVQQRSQDLHAAPAPPAPELRLGDADEPAHARPADRAFAGVDPHALLDRLCQAIPEALEAKPKLDTGPILAEVVASRAVDRSIREPLRMLPCLSWLDRFSRFDYPDASRRDIAAVAAAMACVTALELEALGLPPQLAALRESVARFHASRLDEAAFAELARLGIKRELFARVDVRRQEQVLDMSRRISQAETSDDIVVSLLRRGTRIPAELTTADAAAYPDVVTKLRQLKGRKVDLVRGVLDASKPGGCPFCYRALHEQERAELRRQHAMVHRACGNMLFHSEHGKWLKALLEDIYDA